MEITVSDEELNSLILAIRKRYDIDFTCYEPKSLKRRVVRCLSVFGFPTTHNLWIKMLREQSFIHDFMNEISVGLTAMFRDPIVWKELKDKVLPALAHKSEIKIWHAGCSTGEEVYTLSIVLQEAGLLHKAKAFATDINLKAIETAKEGKYHKIKLAEYAKNYENYSRFGRLDKYSQRESENYGIMDPQLIQHVTFDFHNLITQRINQQFDIIFCRNVMIYFDATAKARLLDQFHQELLPSGFFIPGFYDTLHSLVDKTKFNFFSEEAKIYRKI